MGRMIDESKIKIACLPFTDADGEIYVPLSAVRQAIVQTPTEDVVEVVRCKDCRLRDTEGCPRMYWECGVLLGVTEDNHFCNYGERKEQT